MAIAIFTKSCTKNISGNKSSVYVTEIANITSLAATTGEVSTVTMGTGKTFHEIQADLDGVLRTEEGEGIGNNIVYKRKVDLIFAKPSTALNTLKQSLVDGSPCGLAVIVVDGNGTCWMVGSDYDSTNDEFFYDRGLKVMNDNVNSGKLPSEEEGQKVTVTLGGDSGFQSIAFDATNAGTIKAGTATFITYV